MNKPGRAVGAIVGALLGVMVALVPSAAQAYVPGSAVAQKPTYNTTLWGVYYSCSYAGWAAVPKYWNCDLRDPEGHQLAHHGGTFSSSGKLTSNYSYLTPNVILCTRANAGYSDGSGSDSDTRCN